MADEIKTNEEHGVAGHQEDKHETHEYDGIVELTNPAPYWIILVLLVTIGFSMVYVIDKFGYPGNGKDQKSEYEKSVAAFVSEKAAMKEKNTAGGTGVDDKQMAKAGQKLYNEKGCIACHGAKGEGNAIGPNLTDASWIHGCKEDQIIAIIANGKAEKGMTPFKNILSEDQIKQVTKYIVSLVGSNPPNAKAAQGVPCK